MIVRDKVHQFAQDLKDVPPGTKVTINYTDRFGERHAMKEVKEDVPKRIEQIREKDHKIDSLTAILK